MVNFNCTCCQRTEGKTWEKTNAPFYTLLYYSSKHSNVAGVELIIFTASQNSQPNNPQSSFPTIKNRLRMFRN